MKFERERILELARGLMPTLEDVFNGKASKAQHSLLFEPSSATLEVAITKFLRERFKAAISACSKRLIIQYSDFCLNIRIRSKNDVKCAELANKIRDTVSKIECLYISISVLQADEISHVRF